MVAVSFYENAADRSVREGELLDLSTDGRVRWLARRGMDTRMFSLDIWLQELAAGDRQRRRWSMADEVFYVLRGSGQTLEWQVEAEIGDRYAARAAREKAASNRSAASTPTGTGSRRTCRSTSACCAAT